MHDLCKDTIMNRGEWSKKVKKANLYSTFPLSDFYYMNLQYRNLFTVIKWTPINGYDPQPGLFHNCNA